MAPNGTFSGIDVLTATADDLRILLQKGSTTTMQLVDLYLDQIDRHNHKGLQLNAMIQLAPKDQLRAYASELDKERAEGRVRGPLHGIPIIVKDNIMTDSSLGMDTTCGSFALKGVKVKSNAPIVDYILKAGMIILGKTNLSEWAGKKGSFIPAGWSAVGGQTQSPYVRGGFVKTDKFIGHSNPCGSSSGSAVGVAAGFAPIALATETDGSITQPAGRASAYGLKATIGAIDTRGTSPYSPFSDSLGAITKSPADIALIMGVLMQRDFTQDLTRTWKGQRIGVVDPKKWELNPVAANPDPQLLEESRAKVLEAADIAERGGAKVVRNVEVPQMSDLEINGRDGIEDVWDHDFASGMVEFLKGYEDPPIRTVKELVQFNIDHADVELPEEFPNGQSQLTDALGDVMKDADYEAAKSFLRRKAKTEGFDRIFEEAGVDIVIGPLDGRIVTIAAAAGYPAGVVPLGYADYLNGRAYGLVIVAGAGREDAIINFMSAWEASNPSLRRPPPQLLSASS